MTCGLSDQVGAIRKRIEESPFGFALVTTPDGILLGRVRNSSLDCDPSLTAEEVMEPGPSTVRADMSPEKLAKRLEDRGFKTAVVSSPEGRLIGVVRCDELRTA